MTKKFIQVCWSLCSKSKIALKGYTLNPGDSHRKTGISKDELRNKNDEMQDKVLQESQQTEESTASRSSLKLYIEEWRFERECNMITLRSLKGLNDVTKTPKGKKKKERKPGPMKGTLHDSYEHRICAKLLVEISALSFIRWMVPPISLISWLLGAKNPGLPRMLSIFWPCLPLRISRIISSVMFNLLSTVLMSTGVSHNISVPQFPHV